MYLAPPLMNCNASTKVIMEINVYYYIGFGDGVYREKNAFFSQYIVFLDHLFFC